MSIPFESFQKVVKSAGLRMVEQAAFHKISVGKNAVYVAKTQKVSRVDLSGFTIKHSAIHKLSEKELSSGKYGRVSAQLDFSKPEERVLEAFSTALTRMKQLAEEGETEAKATRKAAGKRTKTPRSRPTASAATESQPTA